MGDTETYYQVQYLGGLKSWEPFGAAYHTLAAARHAYIDCVCDYLARKVCHAVRIVTVWQDWDAVWRVKDVVEYRE